MLLASFLSAVAQEDTFEPNNAQSNATEIPADGTVQVHTFHSIRDLDWITFEAVPGTLYLVDYAGVNPTPAPSADTAVVGGYVPPEQNLRSGSFDEDLNNDRLGISAQADRVYIRFSPHGAIGTYSITVIPIRRENVAVTSRINVDPPTVRFGNVPSGSGIIYGGGEGAVVYRWVTMLPDGSTVKSNPLHATMELTTGKATIPAFTDFPGDVDGNYLTHVEIVSLDTVRSNVRPYAIFGRGEVTAIATPAVSPRSDQLFPNFPNPSNSETVIHFRLAQGGMVRLFVYNVAGHRVASIVDEVREPGSHYFHWNGMDEQGRPLASGIYFYRLLTDRHVQTRKLAILR